MNQDNNDGIYFDTGREHRRWRRILQWWWRRRRRRPHGAATARPAQPAGPSLACAGLPACTHSLTARKGTRENLFLVPIQPFQPLQRPPWSGVFSTNSRRNYRGHSSRERGRSKISRFVIFINYLQVNQSCLNFFIFIMDTKI